MIHSGSTGQEFPSFKVLQFLLYQPVPLSPPQFRIVQDANTLRLQCEPTEGGFQSACQSHLGIRQVSSNGLKMKGQLGFVAFSSCANFGAFAWPGHICGSIDAITYFLH